MRSILEELFYGNICPNTDCRSHDKETKQLMGYMALNKRNGTEMHLKYRILKVMQKNSRRIICQVKRKSLNTLQLYTNKCEKI